MNYTGQTLSFEGLALLVFIIMIVVLIAAFVYFMNKLPRG